MTSLTITVPCTPPRALSPNASRFQHWGTKARAKSWLAKTVKFAAMADARATYGVHPVPLFVGPTRCQLTVYWEARRKRMDGDNLLAAMKHGLDALIAAGVIGDDKHLIHLPAIQERDKDGVGYTVIELWEEV